MEKTKKFYIILAIVVIIAVAGVAGYFVLSGTTNPPTKTTIDLYNNEQNSIDSLINAYKSNPDVDNETIKWLESLDSSYVTLMVLGGGVNGHVVMKRDEANKIPNDNDTSVMSKVVIEGYVKETHHLAYSDVSLIEDVKFIGRQPI
ncbi:MAG: hypothetical protein LBM96_02395 [Methanobrevibacter sp.]|nr:hypothetical protein [Candidatus Methanoflexus mossambicus]